MWDFITKLLKLKDPVTGQKYNAVLVIINKLTKWGYFVTCTEKISTKDVIQIYVKKLFLKYELLEKIILNKDMRFMAAFWEVFLAK